MDAEQHFTLRRTRRILAIILSTMLVQASEPNWSHTPDPTEQRRAG
jgi:hypothetical protein